MMNSYKLLIVENDEDERFFMQQEFEAFEGFQVLGVFMNGDTLLEWFEKNPVEMPDFILSDLNMPGINGYDILSHFAANPDFNQIRIIITSTSSVLSVKERCLALGAMDYLIKPDIFINYAPYVKELYRKIIIAVQPN